MDQPYQDNSDFLPPIKDYLKQIIEDSKSGNTFQVWMNVSALGEAVDHITQLETENAKLREELQNIKRIIADQCEIWLKDGIAPRSGESQ